MLTATEIYKEYARCLTSPIYAVETYLETFDKTRERSEEHTSELQSH